jgi:hypothetical protein
MIQKIRENCASSPILGLPSEALIFTTAIVIFLAIGFIEASRLPLSLDAWRDEVMFVDPAANLYLGHGFNSSVWFAQAKDKFWAGYPPLYSFLLYLWMKVFGFSQSGARALNGVLITLSAFMLWQTVIKLNLVSSTIWRVVLLISLIVIAGYDFDYRSGRPDILMIALSISLLLAYSIQQKPIRYLSLTFICIIFPFSGLALVAYTFFLSVLALICLRKPFLKEFLAIMAGLAIGLLGLFSFYAMHGVWKDFIISTVNNPTLSISGPRIFLERFIYNFKLIFTGSRIFKLLFFAILGIVIYRLIKRQFQFCSLSSFGLLVGFGIPFAMRTVGAYPLYYNWMACAPIAICICSEMAKLSRFETQRWGYSLIVGSVVVLILFSPPFKLFDFIANWKTSDYSYVENFVNQNFKKEDWVIGDFLTYYALKSKVEVVMYPCYTLSIPDREKEKVSAIIIQKSHTPPTNLQEDFQATTATNLKALTDKLGGIWHDSGKNLTLQITKDIFNVERVELGIYRRS